MNGADRGIDPTRQANGRAGGSADRHSGPAIGVALKLTPRRVNVDAITGETRPDRVPAGASASGLAALEVALRLGEAWHSPVTVVTIGTAAADLMLRDALARGADSAIRIEVPPGHGTGPPGMPAALGAAAGVLAAALAGHPVVLCGDGGHGSGTGAIPALLAARAGRAQALGLTGVEPAQARRRPRRAQARPRVAGTPDRACADGARCRGRDHQAAACPA